MNCCAKAGACRLMKISEIQYRESDYHTNQAENQDDGHARGRPVGVAFDKSGALLIADDIGNTVWRVSSE